MLFRKKVLFFKLETVYGTDAVPVAANAIQTMNLKVTPFEVDTEERSYDTPNLVARPKLVVGKRVLIEFETEIAGAGAAGTVPGYGGLLRACGHAEVITAATKVEYNPVSGSLESGTAYFYQDGTFHKITGARGSVSLGISALKIPVLKWKFIGLYNPPTDNAPANPDYTKFKIPAVVSTGVTSLLSLHSKTLAFESLDLDLGNDLQHRMVVGSEEVSLQDRGLTGTAVVDAQALATVDWFQIAASAATGALQLQHGQTPGNIFVIDMPKVQIAKVDYQDSKGVVAHKLDLIGLPNLGNDEWKLTVK